MNTPLCSFIYRKGLYNIKQGNKVTWSKIFAAAADDDDIQ